MYQYYYVNNDQTHNPGLHHEVHTQECAEKLGIINKSYLGCYNNCQDALTEAKKKYYDADGCVQCCYYCHTG